MFKRPENPIKKALDVEILALLNDMHEQTDYDEEYEKMVASVVKLHELRQKERISMDTVVNVVTHLGGLVVLMQHERVHVIATKAFGMIKKIV